MRLWVVLVALCACKTPLDELDGAYYAWDDRQVHCTIEIDDRAGFAIADIEAGLDRVKQSGEVLELLVHIPGVSITWENFEAVLAAAKSRELPFLTQTDLLRGPPRAGIALQYDDWNLEEWIESAPLLEQYGATVTLFVARYGGFSAEDKAQLRALADRGHDIEAHSRLHRRGPTFVEEYGVDTYLADEVVPSIDLLAADGYEVLSYAYPFGMRTDEMDRAILGTHKVEVVRALAKANELRANPCPN